MADASLLQVVSKGIGQDGRTSVLLQWEAVEGVKGYNIYRRKEGAPARPSAPINGKSPITVPISVRQLQSIVSRRSPEWAALSRAFAHAAGGPGVAELADPRTSVERGLTWRERQLVEATARANRAMGHVAGLAFTDRKVVANERYLYELRGVLADGSERRLAIDIPVWAGHFILPDPPSGLTAEGGDRRALILWNRNPFATTYIVERSTTPGGPFQRVNPQPVAYDMDTGLNGETLSTPRPGFLDISAWDPDGAPTSHSVAGVDVFGPDNGTPYWYRVASCDSLDRAGAWSAAVAATPVRTVPPMAPEDLQVSPTTSANGLVVTWRKVTRNVENHRLPDSTQTNYIYRAETREALEDLASLPTHLVATISANPQDPTTPLASWTDVDPILVPPYGTKPFFYRVRTADPFGNVGAPSAVIAAAVPDTIPPGPTELIAVTGDADHIHVEWKPNGEPDTAGYQVYRGVCDRGFIYRPGVTHTKGRDGKVIEHGASRLPCDMTLVGDIGVGDANAMYAANGSIAFDDFSVPAGSPLCYGYWVRAYDFAGNLYQGHRGCPRAGEYRCARLREKTPPPVPVLTGLRARNRAVLVEWVCAPVQDLRAFHVYRSDGELDPPTFLACVFTDGTVSATPWKGLVPSCDDVPAVLDPLAARGSFLDTTADPHHVYWYRVSALDWLGNESEGADIGKISASGTFTYSGDLPDTPMITPPAQPVTNGCGLEVSWGPPFDPAAVQGFVVFRAGPSGSYRQVSGILQANGFVDASARRNVNYLYRVQSIDSVGILSQPSAPALRRY